MKKYLKDALISFVQRLVWTPDVLQRLASIVGESAHAQDVKLAAQIGTLEQELALVRQQLAAMGQHLPTPSVFQKTICEITGANQAAQVLLSLHYRDIAHRGFSLPEFFSTEFRCFSQNGEDGLLLYLFSIIGTTNRKAVEICAGDGTECNISNLIVNHGWQGLLFDGDEGAIRRGTEFFSQCRDTWVNPPILVSAWITIDNVNSLIAERGFVGDVDLLSLDLDGMDYWIWKKLTAIAPRVVILEFNPVWGPHASVSVPYSPDFRLDLGRPPYCCGASLAAWVKLGRQKGYRLVGLERRGFNAVFLRSDTGIKSFPEVSATECFEQTPTLRMWCPDWIPNSPDRPEWGQVVEV